VQRGDLDELRARADAHKVPEYQGEAGYQGGVDGSGPRGHTVVSPA
jgi:hypothetical protein